MVCKRLIWFIISLRIGAANLYAQSVLYSPFIGSASDTRFEVIGKAGDYYWVQKSKKYSSFKKEATPWLNDKKLAFEIYDARLNLVKTVPYTLPGAVIKQYLIAGNQYFDLLQISTGYAKTALLLTRYTPDGNVLVAQDTLQAFSNKMKADDILLVRSQDKSKLLLLGFEPVEDAPPQVHATIYTSNWQVLHKAIYNDRGLSQPYVQYDFIDYPLEHFDNSPVKLANNGDWVMVAPSRRSVNYMLCHFLSSDSLFIQTEIRQRQSPDVQNLSLIISNDNREASIGILINSSTPSIKKVRTAHYILPQCRFDFDSSYRINTLATSKRDDYLYEQYFLPVPGKGFLFLKEYGQLYAPTFAANETNQFRSEEEPGDSIADQVPAPIKKDDYTRYSNLSSARKGYDRGDLRLYFFPATKSDSCWSGLINKEQTGDLNSSYLSYACMPWQGKIIFLYNSAFYKSNKSSSTTFLDQHGNALNEGLVFWRSHAILNFQRARQIAANELAVPYDRNRLQGFAVIHL